MAGGEKGGAAYSSRSLEQTPTWAVATVCFVIIAISILIEHLIHLISKWLKGKKKAALFEAMEKLRSVLMVLGFMSLILTVTQTYIVKICVPNRLATSMLPCHKSYKSSKTTKALGFDDQFHDRMLADDSYSSDDYCDSKGKTSIISKEGANQLSIFLFVLAAMQIVYSVITMALGRAKMRHWKGWEKETQTVEYQAANDPNRFRFTRQTTFARRHMINSCMEETTILLWIKCFFQQFFTSVAKVDYLTLRHSFISTHVPTNTSFNFQKYIQRSLEDDFKVVVGISPFMWLLVVIFLLVDVHGWNVYLWVSFLPLTIVLVLGTKLQVIVAKMAHQVKNQSSVIRGAPLVQPNDTLFWFNRPKFVLTLLHYTLFMNAFEAAFFVWVTTQYGIKSCYHEHTGIIIARVVLAVTVQVLCSYITLPLYALVTQMGSNFKSAAIENQTAQVIKQWHTGVKQKRKQLRGSSHVVGKDDYSNNEGSVSMDLASHHRTPTLSETASFPAKSEIIVEEDRDEIQQEEEETGPAMTNSIAANIEMSTTNVYGNKTLDR